MKLEDLLKEDHADYLASNMNSQLVARFKEDTRQDVDARTVINRLMHADPTQQSKYIHWITTMYVRGQFKMEDIPRIKHELTEFERVKSKLDIKDIGQYRSLPQLYQALAPYQHTDVESNNSANNATREKMYAQADVIHKESDFTLLSPRTEEAAKYFGRGTKWGVSAEEDNTFEQYNKKSPVYIFTDNQGTKYQLYFPEPKFDGFQKAPGELPQVRDSSNRSVPLAHIIKRYPDLLEILRSKTTFRNWANTKNASAAIWYAENVEQGRWQEGEPSIMKDPTAAIDYAERIIKGRWADAEPAIVKNAWSAISYCARILKARWPAAEPNIMKQSDTALVYAKHVIKGRWPEAEKIIKSHPEDAATYKRDVLKGAEWPDEADTSRHGSPAKKEKVDS